MHENCGAPAKVRIFLTARQHRRVVEPIPGQVSLHKPGANYTLTISFTTLLSMASSKSSLHLSTLQKSSANAMFFGKSRAKTFLKEFECSYSTYTYYILYVHAILCRKSSPMWFSCQQLPYAVIQKYIHNPSTPVAACLSIIYTLQRPSLKTCPLHLHTCRSYKSTICQY